MKYNIDKETAILSVKTSLAIIGMILIIILTISLQKPTPIEINQITFAGKEIINFNNKPAFDLISWSPGYTDQALIQIKNNTQEKTSWTVNIKNIENIDETILKSIDIYIKEYPKSVDILKYYDSPITDGYKYIGNLSEYKNSEITSGELINESIELSILFHVREDSDIEKQIIEFRNILKITTTSQFQNLEKTFE